jgi:carbon-monoxide dehydrogenase small subunit
MMLAAIDLLNEHPDPSEEEIRHGLEGNLCRCTGYQNIVQAVRSAALAMGTHPEAAEQVRAEVAP